jgi:hypothetical protein
VHHAYVAKVSDRAAEPGAGSVYQLVCSPVHQQVPPSMRLGFRVGWSRTAEVVARFVRRVAGVPRPPLSWDKLAGPSFGNQLATLTLDGRAAKVEFQAAEPVDERTARMRPTSEVTLASDPQRSRRYGQRSPRQGGGTLGAGSAGGGSG